MKKYLLNALLLLTLLSWQDLLQAQTPANDPNWEQVPVWRDEFSGSSINTSYWNVRNNYDHYHYRMENGVCKITDEGQVYTNRKRTFYNSGERDSTGYNYDVSGGALILLLQKDSIRCPEDKWTQYDCSMEWYEHTHNLAVTNYKYTGADVELKEPYKIQYGYLEARVKVNCGIGFFPAFWIFGTVNGPEHQGTEYQEVDIFEMIYGDTIEGTNQMCNENIMTSNIHYVKPQGGNVNPPSFYRITDYRNYHNYGLEWTPSKLIYYVDGAIYRIEKNNGIYDPKTVILNFAVHEKKANEELESVFPGVMHVDYVRFYKPRTDYSTTLNMNNYNFSTHDNKVKKKIVASGSNQLQTTDNVNLRASEGVEINGEFTVPVGAELYIDVNTAYY